jgi:hypothetical protein
MAIDNIKIPQKYYTGMVKRSNDELPLGFITPWGEDAAAKKRMTTVDNWAGYNSSNNYNNYQTSIKPIVIDNTPVIGFRLSGSIRTSDYGGENKWRIIDPRGFELEITSGNLAKLLSVGVFDQGEILDQCVWARKGANNILLSVNTNEYKEAVKNTEVASKSAVWSDVKLGDTVVLQNNTGGIFLGKQYMLVKNYSEKNELGAGNSLYTCNSKPVYVIYNPNYNNTGYTQQLLLINNPKLSSFTKSEKELTQNEAELLANNSLSSKTTWVDYSGYNSVVALAFNNIKPLESYTLTKNVLQIPNETNLEQLVKHRAKLYSIFVEINKEYFGEVTNRYNSNLTADLYSTEHLNKNELRKWYIKDNSYRHYGNYITNQVKYEYDQNDVYFTIELCIKTKAGNEFKKLI